MIRRSIFLILSIFVVASASLYAQQADSVASGLDSLAVQEQASADTLGRKKGVHPLYETHHVAPNVTNWALYVTIGANMYDGDFTSEKMHAFYGPTAALGLTYHFNNTWAVGAEYKFRNYHVTGAKGHAPNLLDGRSHQFSGFMTFDVFNFFFPRMTQKVFSMDLVVGASALWYKNFTFYPNVYQADLHKDFVFQQHTLTQQPQSDEEYSAYGAFMGGASFEFNVSRAIQLGARILYTYSTTDQWDGRIRGNNNDGAMDVEFLLRYKINSVYASHTRNFRSSDALAMMTDEPRKVADTVVVKHVDTLYISSRDTLYIVNRESSGLGRVTASIPGNNDETVASSDAHYYYVVYFDNDVQTLDNMAQIIVQEAAERMSLDGDVYALIIGSCDNTGAVEYNKWLAVKRAHNVANELKKKYGVADDHIHIVGRGIMIDNRPEGSYRPNRRVEIHLLGRDEFEQAIQIYKEYESNKNVKRGSAVRQKDEVISTQSNITVEIPEDLNLENGDHVMVHNNTTLQNLALKYYNNSNCWIYIYLANANEIILSEQVVEGTSILLPQLSDRQRSITTEEVTELLKQYVHIKE